MKSKIQDPEILRGKEFEEHLLSFDWKNEEIKNAVQDINMFGRHMPFCVGQGLYNFLIPVKFEIKI